MSSFSEVNGGYAIYNGDFSGGLMTSASSVSIGGGGTFGVTMGAGAELEMKTDHYGSLANCATTANGLEGINGVSGVGGGGYVQPLGTLEGIGGYQLQLDSHRNQHLDLNTYQLQVQNHQQNDNLFLEGATTTGVEGMEYKQEEVYGGIVGGGGVLQQERRPSFERSLITLNDISNYRASGQDWMETGVSNWLNFDQAANFGVSMPEMTTSAEVDLLGDLGDIGPRTPSVSTSSMYNFFDDDEDLERGKDLLDLDEMEVEKKKAPWPGASKAVIKGMNGEHLEVLSVQGSDEEDDDNEDEEDDEDDKKTDEEDDSDSEEESDEDNNEGTINENDNSKTVKSKLVREKRIESCTICNIQFPTPGLFESHMASDHNDSYPYPCSQCEKKFAKYYQREAHVKIHDPDRYKGAPLWGCSECDKTYHVRCSIYAHYKQCHRGVKPKALKLPPKEASEETSTAPSHPFTAPVEVLPVAKKSKLKLEVQANTAPVEIRPVARKSKLKLEVEAPVGVPVVARKSKLKLEVEAPVEVPVVARKSKSKLVVPTLSPPTAPAMETPSGSGSRKRKSKLEFQTPVDAPVVARKSKLEIVPTPSPPVTETPYGARKRKTKLEFQTPGADLKICPKKFRERRQSQARSISEHEYDYLKEEPASPEELDLMDLDLPPESPFYTPSETPSTSTTGENVFEADTPDSRPGHYQCLVCKKMFTHQFSLKTHSSIHTGEKPYQCDLCNERFRLKHTLRLHVQRKHRTKEDLMNILKLYKCRLCGKADFLMFNELYLHRTRKHKEVPYDKEKEKPFGCGVCLKPYYMREDAIICSLFGHDPEKILETMFKYKCPRCPKTCLGYHKMAFLRKHWDDEHPDKKLPSSLKWGMSNEDRTLEDKNEGLPYVRINKAKVQDIREYGLPKGTSFEVPLYCDLTEFGPSPREEHLMASLIVQNMEEKKFNGAYHAASQICTICGEELSNRGNLKRHLTSVHISAEILKEEEESGEGPLKIKRRPSIEDGGEEPPKAVVEMEDVIKAVVKKGKRRRVLDSDEEEETKEKEVSPPPQPTSFQCKFCDKIFPKKRALQFHEVRGHLNPKKRSAPSRRGKAAPPPEELESGSGSDSDLESEESSEEEEDTSSEEEELFEAVTTRSSSTSVKKSVDIKDQKAVGKILNNQTVNVGLSRLNPEEIPSNQLPLRPRRNSAPVFKKPAIPPPKKAPLRSNGNKRLLPPPPDNGFKKPRGRPRKRPNWKMQQALQKLEAKEEGLHMEGKKEIKIEEKEEESSGHIEMMKEAAKMVLFGGKLPSKPEDDEIKREEETDDGGVDVKEEEGVFPSKKISTLTNRVVHVCSDDSESSEEEGTWTTSKATSKEGATTPPKKESPDPSPRKDQDPSPKRSPSLVLSGIQDIAKLRMALDRLSPSRPPSSSSAPAQAPPTSPLVSQSQQNS